MNNENIKWSRKDIQIFSLQIFALITCAIEIDLSVPCLPEMAQFFSASIGEVQNTLTYNFLGLLCDALIYGPLSDIYGRKPILIFGLALMNLSSIGCYMASSLFIYGVLFKVLLHVRLLSPLSLYFLIALKERSSFSLMVSSMPLQHL